MKKKIIIVGGDPNSINSEIIYKCWKKLNNSIKKKIFLISNYELIKKQFKLLKYPTNILAKINTIDNDLIANKLNVLDVDLNFDKPFNVKKKYASKFVMKSLDLAHKLVIKHKMLGIVNCAIDKRLLNKDKIGVTEYLATKCNITKNSEVMLITNQKLSVCPLTIHIDIKDVSKKITKTKIIKKIETINFWFKKKFKKKPKISVLGLNPHNAELRKKSEEINLIIPSINLLKKKKINVQGPFAADSFFIHDYKKFDVVIGMFHDQVLVPFKTIFKFDAINVTLGLKYLRVSPDHGTGINLIGKNKANYFSLVNCIKFINKFGK